MLTYQDREFQNMAYWFAQKSVKSSSGMQAGAVIVEPNGRFVSYGYAHLPRGLEHIPVKQDRAWLLGACLHAEERAIHEANQDISGCYIFCTHYPCASCMRAIIHRGIIRVVYGNDPQYELRWKDDLAIAKELATHASIECNVMVRAAPTAK